MQSVRKETYNMKEYTLFDEELRQDYVCPRCLGKTLKSQSEEICKACEGALNLLLKIEGLRNNHKN